MSKDSKLAKSLLKRGAQFALGSELVKVGKGMKKSKEEMIKNQSIPEEKVEEKKHEEYIFYLPAVKQINDVVSYLSELLLSNGIDMDAEMSHKAQEIIEAMSWIVDKNEREQNNDSVV